MSAKRSYAEVVSGIGQSWMQAYQKESEEDALLKAIELSKDESLHVISDSSDDGWSIAETPGFGNKPSSVPATSTADGVRGHDEPGPSGYSRLSIKAEVIDLTNSLSPVKIKKARDSSTESETTTDDEGIPDNVPKPGKQRKCDPEMWDTQ